MPTDRDLNAASLALDVIGAPPLPGAALVVDAPELLAEALRGAGSTATAWRRHAIGGPAAETPPEGQFDAAFLRMPRARDALRLAAHQLAAALPAGAPLFVFGNNDEGIKSAGSSLAPVFAPAETIVARRHARLVRAVRTDAPAQADLDAWATTRTLALPGGPRDLVSYPGCFAKGGLDPGTALLLGALPGALAAAARPDPAVLDLACGIGVLAAAVRDLAPAARLDGCDADALAVRAAARNVAFDRLVCGDGPLALPPPAGGWDLVVSNPPVHDGFDDDTGIIARWAAALPDRLAPGAAVLLVVQRHRPVQGPLAAIFGSVAVVAEGSGYRVYLCR